ncbi:MAG: DMT family transporter [Bacillota bacterium]|nr:DMT family transporter [Bacillota bacterium]
MKLLALLIAAGAGAAMAVQGGINTALGKAIGLLEATLVVHLLSAASAALLLFGLRLGQGDLQQVGSTPWYLFLGGLLGVAITFGVVLSMKRVGVAAATTAIVVAQVLTAALVDHLGLFGLLRIPFSPVKVVGILLLGGGAWILLAK